MIELMATNGKKVLLDDHVYEQLMKVKVKGGKICGSPHLKYFRFFDGSNRLYIHRWVYETFVAPIPDKHDIHHIDNDSCNNLLSNLECVEQSRHCYISIYGRHKNKLHNIKLSRGPKRFIVEVKIKGVYASKAFKTSEEAVAWRDEQYAIAGVKTS